MDVLPESVKTVHVTWPNGTTVVMSRETWDEATTYRSWVVQQFEQLRGELHGDTQHTDS